jgi:hypothetical protein
MSDDAVREQLAALDAAYATKLLGPQSLWDLVKSIHSLPILREWVTLESEPLLPLVSPQENPVSQKSGEAVIHVLLCTRSRGNDDDVLLPPWGYVQWHWPSKRLLRFQDVTDLFQNERISLSTTALCSKEFSDAVQQALETGKSIPPMPACLITLYSKLTDTSWCEASESLSQNNISDAGCSEPRVVLPPKGASAGISGCSGVTQHRSSPRELGHDSRQIEGILDRVEELIGENDFDSTFLDEYRRISDRLLHPVFSVAVVGEFSRGKSTIINRVLEHDFLPVGDTPTTTMLARIRYGAEPSLCFIKKDRTREEMDLSESSWQSLAERKSGQDYEGFLVINLHNEWLRTTGIHLIDTPGAGDIIDIRAALVTEAIANSDAVLVAINATLPLSLTERAFIEEQVLAKGTPRTAIVLTRLDLLLESEKKSVVDHVRSKLREWAPHSLLWSCRDEASLTQNGWLDASGAEQIRSIIASWSSSEEREFLIQKQVASQLRDLILLLRDSLEIRKQSLLASSDEREKVIAQAEEALDRTRMDWEDLRLPLRKRQMLTEEWLQQAILETQGDIRELLTFQLDHSRNPGEWWEKDLPFLLRKELRNFTKTLEVPLRRRLQEDTDWIVQQIRAKLTWNLGPPAAPLVRLDAREHGDVMSSNLSSDLSKTRSYARVAAAASTGAAFLLAGTPLVAIGGILAVLTAEKFLDGKIDEQKRFLTQRLDLAVEKSLRSVMDNARQTLCNVYENLLETSRREEASWFKIRLQDLRQGARNLNEKQSLAYFEGQTAQASTILSDLACWLEGDR